MHQRILIAFVVLILVSCSTAQLGFESTPTYTPMSALHVVQVDDVHNFQLYAGDPDRPTPLAYEIPAGRGFILDVEGYEFHIPPDADFSVPNVIQVLDNDVKEYNIEWQPNVSRYPIVAQNLKSSDGTMFFPELESDQLIMVMIGHEYRAGELQGGVYVLWVGMMKVR